MNHAANQRHLNHAVNRNFRTRIPQVVLIQEQNHAGKRPNAGPT